MFLIKPLNWRKNNEKEYIAYTPFGNYNVFLRESETKDQWWWSYCYDETLYKCDSLEEGKKQSQKHWEEKIKKCLISTDRLDKIKKIVINPQNRSSKTLKQQCELMDRIYQICVES